MEKEGVCGNKKKLVTEIFSGAPDQLQSFSLYSEDPFNWHFC